MNSSSPTEIVVEFLSRSQFRAVATPFVVGSIPFEFDAILVGTGSVADVVVVIDTTMRDSQDWIVRQVVGLGRALDAMKSLRPVNIVLVGPKLSAAPAEAVFRVGRILNVKDVHSEYELKNSLAVLLPLEVPQPRSAVIDVTHVVKHSADENTFEARLFSAARLGPDEVRDTFLAEVESAFDKVDGVEGTNSISEDGN